MRRQFFVFNFLRGDLKHLQRVAGAADLIREAGDKERAEVMAQQLMLGEQGDVLVLGDFRCIPGLLGQLVIPQLLCRLDDRFAGGLRDGTPVVEDLGDRVAAQPAGGRNILDGDSFECHVPIPFPVG